MNYSRFIGNLFISPEDKVEILIDRKLTPQYADVIRRIVLNKHDIMLDVVMVRPNVGKHRLSFYLRCRICRHSYKIFAFMNDFLCPTTTSRVRFLTNIGDKCSYSKYFYFLKTKKLKI